MTSIQWTDETWNPTRGCSVVSPGCVNCYAMKQAHRFSGKGKAYDGLTKLTSAGPQWTGRVVLDEPTLRKPLSWTRPRRVFVNSMSDLFHEDVPFEFIDKVFAVMALAERHTFQILTKRADRMHRYMTSRPASPTVPREVNIATESGLGVYHVRWPLPNVWLGVSVENQRFYDERISLLLSTPAAVRFISAEPLLGAIDLRLREDGSLGNEHRQTPRLGLDWVIVGGESGPGARPMQLEWAESIVSQCRRARVPVFVKQLGSLWRGISFRTSDGGNHRIVDRKAGDPSEWPEDLRVREFPEVRA